MGYIFYLMGKSSSGKDTIYKGLINMEGFPLKTVKGYTTRPMRSGETNGVEYHFVDNFQFNEMLDKGIILYMEFGDILLPMMDKLIWKKKVIL